MGRWAHHNKEPSNSVHDMLTTHGMLYSHNSESLSSVVTVALCMHCITQMCLLRMFKVTVVRCTEHRLIIAHLGEALQSVEVTADFDIAVVTVPGKVVKLVYINAVASVGHNVKQKALVIQWRSTIASRLVVGTGSHNELLHALHVNVIKSVIFDVTIIDDGLQDLAAHLLVTPKMYTVKHQYSNYG